MSPVWSVMTWVAALGSGLIAGTFFAFSAFVMAALARLPKSEGIAAMQSINRTAVRPPLMAVLFGTAAVGLGLAVWAAINLAEDSAWWILGGSALYLLGCIAVTIVCNVPMNEALAKLNPGDPAAAGQWAHYVSVWTAWNTVRGLAALGAAALFIVALV